MTGPEDGRPLGGRGVTFAVAAIAVAVFGLVGGLPVLLGPIVGVVTTNGLAVVKPDDEVVTPLEPLVYVLPIWALALTPGYSA